MRGAGRGGGGAIRSGGVGVVGGWGDCDGGGEGAAVVGGAGVVGGEVGRARGQGVRGAVWHHAVLHQLGRQRGAARGLRLHAAQGRAAAVRRQ